MFVSSLSEKKICIIGAARSGVAAAKLLRKQGIAVFVSDMAPEEKNTHNYGELRVNGIEFEAGEHSSRVFESDIMVISPGVPTNAPVVLEARQKGINVIAEIEVASWFCKAPIVAITGSNGKTTTTTLLGRICSEAEKPHVVAGNIGEAFSNVVESVGEEHVVILEVSSFQLDAIDTFRPSLGILLNITRNHLDRYNNSMELYAASKTRLFQNQNPEDFAVINNDDQWAKSLVRSISSRCLRFGTQIGETDEGAYAADGILTVRFNNETTPVIPVNEIALPGEHNLQNAMAASVAAAVIGIDPRHTAFVLKNFSGVEHRQEFVRDINNVRYINNSKATTVESVEYAIRSYDQPIVLIMGGKDKGNEYSSIVELVRRKVRAIVATGYSADVIVKNFSGVVPVVKIETSGKDIPNIISMKKAVTAASGLAKEGDIVLLAPACTSFDWFTDYEERGRVFKQIVHTLAGE